MPPFFAEAKKQASCQSSRALSRLGFLFALNRQDGYLDIVENTIGCHPYRCVILYITRHVQVREHEILQSSMAGNKKDSPDMYSATVYIW